MARELCILRVQQRPYIVTAAMYGPVTLLFVPIIMNNRKGTVLISTIFLIYMFVFIYLLGALYAYRIELSNDALIDRGFKITKRAPINTIYKIQMEIGWGSQKWLWRTTLRPFRRLAVYYTIGDQERSIDISLNHFC
jgi:hypothetical protein